MSDTPQTDPVAAFSAKLNYITQEALDAGELHLQPHEVIGLLQLQAGAVVHVIVDNVSRRDQSETIQEPVIVDPDSN